MGAGPSQPVWKKKASLWMCVCGCVHVWARGTRERKGKPCVLTVQHLPHYLPPLPYRNHPHQLEMQKAVVQLCHSPQIYFTDKAKQNSTYFKGQSIRFIWVDEADSGVDKEELKWRNLNVWPTTNRVYRPSHSMSYEHFLKSIRLLKKKKTCYDANYSIFSLILPVTD